jgi:hypothetical protein
LKNTEKMIIIVKIMSVKQRRRALNSLANLINLKDGWLHVCGRILKIKQRHILIQ